MGNCLISAAILYGFLKHCHIPPSHYEACINGDDVVVLLKPQHERRFVDALPAFYAKAGFEMKISRSVNVLEHIEFCQTHPVFDGKCWRMVRNVPHCFSKDSFIIKPVATQNLMPRYYRTLGECGMALCSGIPMCQAYYWHMFWTHRYARALGDPSLETGM